MYPSAGHSSMPPPPALPPGVSLSTPLGLVDAGGFLAAIDSAHAYRLDAAIGTAVLPRLAQLRAEFSGALADNHALLQSMLGMLTELLAFKSDAHQRLVALDARVEALRALAPEPTLPAAELQKTHDTLKHLVQLVIERQTPMGQDITEIVQQTTEIAEHLRDPEAGQVVRHEVGINTEPPEDAVSIPSIAAGASSGKPSRADKGSLENSYSIISLPSPSPTVAATPIPSDSRGRSGFPTSHRAKSNAARPTPRAPLPAELIDLDLDDYHHEPTPSLIARQPGHPQPTATEAGASALVASASASASLSASRAPSMSLKRSASLSLSDSSLSDLPDSDADGDGELDDEIIVKAEYVSAPTAGARRVSARPRKLPRLASSTSALGGSAKVEPDIAARGESKVYARKKMKTKHLGGVWPAVAKGQPEQIRNFIQCETCKGWLHYGCAGLAPEDIARLDRMPFDCPLCEAAKLHHKQRPGARASLRALCFRPHCRFKTRKDKESYVVEAIVGRDPNPEGGWRYLIKWDRYPMSEATWEPEDNFQAFVPAFHEALRREGKNPVHRGRFLLKDAKHAAPRP